MLMDIKKYLSERQRASLNDIAIHLKAQPEAVKAMMSHWEKKQKVKIHRASSCSSSCNKCLPSGEYYEWLE